MSTLELGALSELQARESLSQALQLGALSDLRQADLYLKLYSLVHSVTSGTRISISSSTAWCTQ
jgi:hypothetical protein